MRKLKPLLFILHVLPLFLFISSNSLALNESGYLDGPGMFDTFVVDTGDDMLVDILFYYPVGSVDFWVRVVDEDEYTILGKYDLDDDEIITLIGGGMFYLTIYSRGGSGNWSATDDPLNAGPNPWFKEASVIAGPNVDTSENMVSGYLTGTGDDCSWSFDVNAYDLDVTFKYPREYVSFWVEVRTCRRFVGIYDLDKNNIVTLEGGKTYYMRIYSKVGAGKWSCTW